MSSTSFSTLRYETEGRIATTSGYLTSASGALWGLDQAIDPRSGRGVGPISLVSVAASDHAVSQPIPLPAEPYATTPSDSSTPVLPLPPQPSRPRLRPLG